MKPQKYPKIWGTKIRHEHREECTIFLDKDHRIQVVMRATLDNSGVPKEWRLVTWQPDWVHNTPGVPCHHCAWDAYQEWRWKLIREVFPDREFQDRWEAGD